MATKTFIDGGVDHDWNTSGNWDPAGVAANGDDVIFNAASPNCRIDITRNIRSLDMTGYTGTITSSGGFSPPTFSISGAAGTTVNCILCGTISPSRDIRIIPVDTATIDLITTGSTINSGIATNVAGATGTIRLQSDLEMNSDLNAGFSTWDSNYYSIIFNSGAANFGGANKTFYDVYFNSTIIVSYSNTFHNIHINTAGLANGVYFEAGSTQTINNLFTNGSAGNLAKMLSTSATVKFNLSKPSRTVSVDYMSIKVCNVTGGALWYAGPHSLDLGTNTGWIWTYPPTIGNFPVYRPDFL